MAENEYKISLGVDLKVNDIRDRITKYNKNSNNAKLKLGVKLDTDDIKRQIRQLNIGGIGSNKGIAIPVNTASLEASLNEVKGIIADIKSSLGSLDKGKGMKDLLSSVNQINDALGKASKQFEDLNSSINALSKKDLNFNLGFNLGGSSNPIARNAAYGSKTRNETLPQLKQQAEALENYLKEYYKVADGFNAAQKLIQGTGVGKGKANLYDLLPRMLDSTGSLSSQMTAYKEYIAILKEAASIRGGDIGKGINSIADGFSKSADELIKDAQDVQTGAKETEEALERLKQIFGGSGLDVDGLSNILDPIITDLGEIKKALKDLSSGASLSGLTQSFNDLSHVLDKLTSNFTLVRNTLNTGLSGAGSGISNVAQEFKEVDIKIGATSTQMQNLNDALRDVGFNDGSIDAITRDFEELGITVKNVTSRLNNDGSVILTVKGLDQYERAVTVMRSVAANGEVKKFGTTISQDFKETENAFRRLQVLAKEMGQLEIKIAGLDSGKNKAEIAELTTQLNRLGEEYSELFLITSRNLNSSQVDALNREFDETDNKLAQINARMSDNSAAKEQTKAFKDLMSILKEIDSLRFELDLLKSQGGNVNQIAELEAQLKSLKKTYKEVLSSTTLTGDQNDSLTSAVSKMANNLTLLQAKIADTKAKLADGIKLKLIDGTFDNDISKINSQFGKLSNKSEEVKLAIANVNNALNSMKVAAANGDIEGLINANKNYEQALKDVNNQLKINARSEKDAAANQKLVDDRAAFQSKIDAWLTKNSAATKKFGASMLELKAQAQSCDRVTLNHLQKEFKQLDKEAEAAGLKIQSFGDRLKTQFSKYSSYFSIASVFMYATQGLRDMFNQVVAIDSAMTELKKVTDETNESYNKFLSNSASRAKEIGTTIDGLVTSTADFARLGYDFVQSQGLAEVANIYTVVGDEIDGVETATKSLISTLAAFKDEASGISDSDFAMDIVDKFNEVSNNFAISSGGIGEAMQRSASSLRAANNTIDESIALITAANTVVQDPVTIGTSFKTISMRIRGAKTEMEELGLDTEGMVESTAKLREEIMALTGVDIMIDKNNFKSTYQIMDELAAKWQDLTDIQQASVTELIAGKRQGNVVSSLMHNFDIARDALETSLNSSGSAMKEHEKWSQSLEARLLKLKATWQSLSQSFLNSNFLKFALDSIISLVNGIDKLISSVGTIPTLLGAFAAFKSLTGKGFFKVIEDEAALSGQRIATVFGESLSNVSKQFNSMGIKTNAEFRNSLNSDISSLFAYRNAVSNGMSVTDAFEKHMTNASEAAQSYAKSNNILTKGVLEFGKQQKAAQVTMVAQSNSLSSAKAIMKEYNGGCKNTAMSQNDFVSAVNKGNPALGKYLSGLNGAKAGMTGYITSLVGAKVATFALQAATMALNMALTMGISALISWGISKLDEWIVTAEELAEKVEEVTSKYKEQHKALMDIKGDYDTSSEDSMISKYEKLSKGVNALGQNVSLTADEYSEYQGIVNQIAEQIPSLVTGYDSQGNALLSCKGNVEELTKAYEKLIEAQNNEILTNSKDIQKDFEKSMEKANSTNAYNDKLTIDAANTLDKMLNGAYSEARITKLLDKTEGARVEIIKALEDAGLENDLHWWNTAKDYDAFIADAIENHPEIVRTVIEDFEANLEENADGIKTISEALLSKAFDISDSDYAKMSDGMRNIAYQIVNSFDALKYQDILDSGTTVEEYIYGILDSLKELDNSDDSKSLEAAFNLQTKFNGGEISYGEYVNGLKNAEKLIGELGLDDEVENQLKLALNTEEVTKDYEALKNRLTSDEYNIQMKTEEAEKFLDGLTSSEYAVAVDLMMSGEVDLSDFDIKSLREYIEKQAKINEAMNYTIAIDVETESLDALNTAMAESVSGAGLSSEAIAALKGRYAELESEGYNLSAMFEETANGIHLNRKAVGELEQKLASNKLVETDKQLSVLKNRYDELTTEIDKCRDAGDRAALYTEQQSIVEKINDLATLASQYEGLTSAYNAWQNAESAGQERDMYESVIEGFENIGDEISRGWVDDGTIKFLELLTGKTDLAGKSGKQLKEIYDGLDDSIKYLNKDGKVLEDTGYSVRDFFTVDEDGNSTNTGVYNFLDAIGKLEEEAFGGKDVVKRDDKGNIIGFDFELVAKKDKNGNVIKNGDQVIAEALGISEELVQIMVRASDDAGFVVNLEGAYTQLADLKTEAESARDTLISLQNKGLKELKGVDVNFDLDAEGGDLVKEQEKSVKLLDKFKKDGKIDLTMEGAQQALDIAEYLTIKLDDLTEPRYMQIDATQVEEDIREPLEDMQEFERLSKEKHLLQLTGDKKKIKEVQDDMDEIANGLEDLDKETKVKLGIDGLTSEEIADKLEKGEIEIPAELNLDVQMSDDLKDMRLMMMNQLGLASDNEVKLKVGFDIDESVVDGLTDEQKEVVVKYIVENEDEFNKYTEEEKETVIKLIADGVDLDNYEVEDKEAIVNYVANGEEADGWTPEAKDAFVKYLVDGGEPDKFDPENKDSWVVYDTDTTKPDGYEPDDEDATVTYDKDSSVPDGYDPNDPTATVTYEKDSSEVDSYNPPNFIRNVVYKIKTAVSNAASKGAKVLKDRFGIGGANGTANVNGTIGRAFKQGSWGTKNSGTALVGELGRETLVRDGRYYTIGNTGAEFIKYQKGDIIFNHKQTEELFANGKVTSGGGRAKAFASGTAFSKGSGGIGRFFSDYESEKSKKVRKEVESKTSTKQTKDGVTTTTTTTVKNGSSGSGGVGKVGGSSISSSSSSSEEEKFEETYDWIETAINRVERVIDQLDKKANSVYRSWSERNSALVGEIDKVKEEIELQQRAYNKYIEEANAVGLSSSWAAKVRNGEIDIDTVTDEDLDDKISKYQEWYEKALDCKDAILELQETEKDLIQQKFDNIIDRYDGYLSVIEHEKSMLEEYINQSETQGWLTSTKYYEALAQAENDNIAKLQDKKAELLAELSNTQAGTQQWYDNVAAIDEVTLAIEQANTALLEYKQTIQELEFEQFDLLQDRISALTEEADFLIELMSNKKLYEDNGQLTDEGMTTMGLHGQSYNVYMHQADMVAEEIKRIEDLMSSSTSNELDMELEERYREMIALQQEYILAAEEEKNAIRDMVEEGIELELDALQEKIDLYNEALDSQKDLYDYQKKVKEQTEEIASLEKQMAAYAGDNSEEAQAKIQELKVSLEDAKADLEETEYEKYISDQEKLLDELYLEYETVLNERLDNIDALIMDMIVEINANAGTISSTIDEVTRAVGYETSEDMKTAWNVNTAEIKEVITNYSSKFDSAHTSTKGVLDAIKLNTQNMINKLDAIASQKAKEAAKSSAANPQKTTTSNKDNDKKKEEPKKTSGGDGVPKVGDAVTFKSGKYYNSSDGLTPTGSALLGKTVYITNINKASWAKKQYHIARDKAGKRPLGWVELSQLSGYATGKKNFLNDELAWTQENGLEEYIVRPSDGAILTPVARKGSVLNAQASENLWNMTNSPAEFIRNNLNLGSANVPNNSNSQNTYTQHLDKVIFNLPNVKNYDELLAAMQKDKNFERLISSMTIDRLAGKSSLAKGKAIR